MILEFEKWEALGNDFILTKCLPSFDLIPKICHRKYGVGADGLIYLDEQRQTPLMKFFNADGTCVAMCGNGLRCAMTYLEKHNRPLKLELEGVVYSGLRQEGRLYVTMPVPYVLNIDHPPYSGLWVYAGVPHFLIEKPQVHQGDLPCDVFENRYHKSFGPQGSNITFYEKQGSSIYLRTAERGVDEETLACGSAAIACSILSDELDLDMIYKTGQKAFVKKTQEGIALAGQAQFVFSGRY